MKLRSILTLSLLAILLLASCAPAAAPEPAQPEAAVQPEPVENEPAAPAPTATAIPMEADPTDVSPTEVPPTEAPTEAPQVVATSRGPDLEATDPTSVSLASGDLQLVEFFRYTWGTCRAMAPMVHGLEAKYYGKVKFSYLDASDPNTREFQRELGFGYQPEFYLLDGDGNLLQKWVGFVSQDQFEAVFAQYLQ